MRDQQGFLLKQLFDHLKFLEEKITAKDHWRECRPKVCRALEKSGKLDQAAKEAARLTRDARADCALRNMTWLEAWEAVREQWLLLPSEEDQPKLRASSPLNRFVSAPPARTKTL
jgi:hypothetical protein